MQQACHRIRVPAGAWHGLAINMKTEEMQYILYRRKTQSYFLNGVPFEYPSTRIRLDMKRAGMAEPPSEAEIENFLNEKIRESSEMILSMPLSGRNIGEIRSWCEHSLECPIPIPSLNQVMAENILSRFDYFNFFVNKVVKNRQLEVLFRHRRQNGPEIDIGKVISEIDRSGLYSLQDEITRTRFYSEGDMLRLLMEEEENSMDVIVHLIDSGLPDTEIVNRCVSESLTVFTDAELPSIVEETARKHRIGEIAKTVRNYNANGIWSFIGVIEAYQMLRITSEGPSATAEKLGIEPEILEKIRKYEGEVIPGEGDPYYHLSHTLTRDLPVLSKLLRAYLSWRSTFHFVNQGYRPASAQESMQMIIQGFSEQNGVDPRLFESLLY